MTPLLVARRSDGGIRDAIWAHLRPIWETRGYEIFEGHHNTNEGPFNRSRAVNRAARAAGDWDLALIADADVWVETWQVDQAVEHASSTGALSFCHIEWRGTTAETRQAVLDGHLAIDQLPGLPDDAWQIRRPLSNSCLMAVTRDLWDKVGGYDERFVGWGAEDWAWHVMCLHYGGTEQRVDAPVYHLHHPLAAEARAAHKGVEMGLTAANHRLGAKYLKARGRPGQIEALRRQAQSVRER